MPWSNTSFCTVAQYYCIPTIVPCSVAKLLCTPTKALCNFTKLFCSPATLLCSFTKLFRSPAATFVALQTIISLRAILFLDCNASSQCERYFLRSANGHLEASATFYALQTIISKRALLSPPSSVLAQHDRYFFPFWRRCPVWTDERKNKCRLYVLMFVCLFFHKDRRTEERR